MASIIIPAHNEGLVIDRCLRAVLETAAPGELEVIVACNGCVDDTAARAARHGPDVRVLDLDVASKPAALNAADAAATRFPRIYLDADIEVSTDAIRRVVAALSPDAALAAAPALRVDLRGCDRPVRAYYRAWTAQQYVRDGLIGSGLYAVSRAGRARFGAFPDIIADDLFVRCHFQADERITVDGCFVVRPPRTARALVVNKTRVFAGNAQLARDLPELPVDAAGESQGIRALAVEQPALVPSLLVYGVLQGAAKLLGRRALRQGALGWRRDVTARGA